MIMELGGGAGANSWIAKDRVAKTPTILRDHEKTWPLVYLSGSGGGGRGPLHELREVELLAEVHHQVELRLEVVNVAFLIGEDVLEDVRRRDVALPSGQGDGAA